MENEWVARVVLFITMFGSGVLLVWMARATASGGLKRNPIAGIRIPSTMVSDEAWLAAHVRARRPTLYAGFVSAASGVLALFPVSVMVVTVGVLVAAVAMIVLVLYAAAVGSRAANAVSAERHERSDDR